MISLRPMRADEFAAYRTYFIPDYAAEIEANFGVTPDAALAQSTKAIDRDLAQGVASDGQVLLCLEDPTTAPESVAGYLWYAPDTAARSVFVCDFVILPQHRNKGLGKAALAALEAALTEQGFTDIQLRVAADNARAQHVYAGQGFRTTGINMSKRIG